MLEQPAIDRLVTIGYPVTMDRLSPDERHALVVDAATAEARRVGLSFITRDAVAKRAGVPAGSMCLFGDMRDIKEMVIDKDPSLANGQPLNRYDAARGETDQKILTAALELAVTGRYDRITRRQIADAAGVSPARVSLFALDLPATTKGKRRSYMVALQTAIMEAAVAQRVAAVVAQGLADRHPVALAASDELKQQALASIADG